MNSLSNKVSSKNRICIPLAKDLDPLPSITVDLDTGELTLQQVAESYSLSYLLK